MDGVQLLQETITALLAEGKEASEIHSLLVERLGLTTEPDCGLPGHWPEPPPE